MGSEMCIRDSNNSDGSSNWYSPRQSPPSAAQYRTKHSRTHRCRRSGRCPARRPAATASRWSRPPTRAACTSGRRRGEPLLCWGLPLFCCPISSTGRGLRAIGALGQLALSKLRQRRMAHIRVLSSVFYWQSASVTSQLSGWRRVGRHVALYVSVAP